MSNTNQFYFFFFLIPFIGIFWYISLCPLEKTETQRHLTLGGGGPQTPRVIYTHTTRVFMKRGQGMYETSICEEKLYCNSDITLLTCLGKKCKALVLELSLNRKCIIYAVMDDGSKIVV